MEVFRELTKRPQPAESLAIGAFLVAVLYAVYAGAAHTALLGVGFTLIVLGALPRQVALAFLVGASAILLVQKKARVEGFESGAAGSGAPGSGAPGSGAPGSGASGSGAPRSGAVAAEPEPAAPEPKKEEAGFRNIVDNKPMLPDNADRKEMLELGKPYKLPNEHDDKGYHLDSGTTFLNAYKALKPDQIAAMTKDTQDLLATQKSLVGMLQSFAPLMEDMSKFTGFFGGNK